MGVYLTEVITTLSEFFENIADRPRDTARVIIDWIRDCSVIEDSGRVYTRKRVIYTTSYGSLERTIASGNRNFIDPGINAVWT